MGMFMLPELTLASLKSSVQSFVDELKSKSFPELYGATDGKTLGTFIEEQFRDYLTKNYSFTRGKVASGIDLPSLAVDIKATFLSQPQSSCPYRDATQKVYGLGYSLLIFVYEKIDHSASRSAQFNVKYTIFVEKERTGDWQTTFGLVGILNREGNKDDIIAFLIERNLPLEEIGLENLANRILQEPPKVGYLTISNALQWRLNYGRAISAALANAVEGVESLYV